MSKVIAEFYQTAGHGYMRVSHFDMMRVGVSPSGYSPRDTTDAYLEEDVDAPVFLRTAQEKGIAVQVLEMRQDSEMEDYIESLF
jgi:hypothetical protein